MNQYGISLSGDEKRIHISGGLLEITIDFDDVDHRPVQRAANALLKLINENEHLLTGKNVIAEKKQKVTIAFGGAE